MRNALLALTLLLFAGCAPATDTAAGRRAVMQGLSMSASGLTMEQIRTFQLDLRGEWAVAYDPADPPGCTPGGLRDAPAPEARPCMAYLLNRRQARWTVLGIGTPGNMDVPRQVPAGLGDPSSLAWLAQP